MRKIMIIMILFCLSKNVFGDESYFPVRNIKRIYTSSELENKYNAEYLIDKTWQSWSEGISGNGIGESFTVEFKLPVKLENFFLKNGYGQLDYFYKNNRVKSFEVFFDDKPDGVIINIEDLYEFKSYSFPGIVYANDFIECSKVTFKINEIYPGMQYDDTCIAEIQFNAPDYRNGQGIIMNSPDIFETYKPDSYTVRLLRAMYEDDGLQFRINSDNMPEIYAFFGFDVGEHRWAEINTTLSITGRGPGITIAPGLHPIYRIFLSSTTNPILIKIKDTYDNLYELKEIKIFENGTWNNYDSESAIIPILDLKNEIEAKGLSCHFQFPNRSSDNYIFEIIINEIKINGRAFSERYSLLDYDIINTHTFYWNGTTFEKK